MFNLFKVFVFVFLHRYMYALGASTTLKNGDIREFYVSAKNLPQSPDGTGQYLYAFVTGNLFTGGRQSWDKEIYSNLTIGPNATWLNDLRNITYKYTFTPVVNFGVFGNYKIAFFERMKNGANNLLMGVWHWDTKIIEYVDKSCTTKLPYEIVYQGSYYNYTYYYHCIRSFNVS